MKTIKQWLEELPNGIRQNAIEQCGHPYSQEVTLSEAVSAFAQWHSTREGFEFWVNVDDGRYSEALLWLKQNKHVVYNEYYAKYFDVKDSQLEDPNSIQVGGSHYKDMAIQPVEFITKNNIPYIEGNIIKYICRYRLKNGVEDLKKAKHYLEMLIESL